MEEHVKKGTGMAKDLITNINRLNFLEVVKSVMEIVECEDTLKGEQAKQVAVLIITKLVEEVASQDKEWLLHVIKSGLLESMIDTLIAASKGLYDLNKSKKCPLRSLLRCTDCSSL